MIIFDVGANVGQDSKHYALDADNTVYAFEPTPQLLRDHLYPYQADYPNYVVVPKAVTDYDGVITFHVAGQHDWGCSSIHEFSEDLDTTWPGRTDFKETEQLTVDCTTMRTFILENNIDRIDYMHCDTQGNDLAVLRSFGDCIDRLVSGRVEVFNKNPLYKNIDNSYDNVVSFLKAHGFYVKAVESNDPFNNELNISFSKS
jgi:FkbM family methyltransferase